MFKKPDDLRTESEAPMTGASSASSSPSRAVSVIGPTLVFKGELSADEDLVIEGRVEGSISHQKKNLTIGRDGRVKADIHAKSIMIQGYVEGDIRGDEYVSLAQSAEVRGNILCPRIKMEDGAQFNGTVDMGQTRSAELSVAKSGGR